MQYTVLKSSNMSKWVVDIEFKYMSLGRSSDRMGFEDFSSPVVLHVVNALILYDTQLLNAPKILTL